MAGFDLQTHVYRVHQNGETVMIKETPYTRIRVAGLPPVFVRNGKAYWETGEELTTIPDELRQALDDVMPAKVEPPTEQVTGDPEIPVLPSQLWRYGHKRSKHFTPIDEKFSKCNLCEKTFRKKECGKHLMKDHKELWRRNGTNRSSN